MHTYTINIIEEEEEEEKEEGEEGDEEWVEEKVITKENGAKVRRSRGDAWLQTLLNLNLNSPVNGKLSELMF